jgi:hypothetical protein
MLRPTVQSASLSWNKAPIWGLRPDLYYCQTIAGLLMWGALSASPPLRVCNPDNWRDGGFLLPPTDSCSMLEWEMYFLSRGTPCVGDHPRTTSSGEAASNLPRSGRTAGSCGTGLEQSGLYIPPP